VRIGVISDTHIIDKAQGLPEEILKDFKHCDMVIHAGDLIDISVLDKLKSVCPVVKAVAGNMDPPEVKAKLPEKQIIPVAKYKIGLMHGYGPAHALLPLLTEAFKKDAVDIIIFGHSHSAYNRKNGRILYFNPGSPTDKIFAQCNSYGIIEINTKIEAKIIKVCENG
jgi:putative phosphoesterase